jgi:hypothetical protein
MTNLPKPAIKPGTVWFYGPDPVSHSALLVTAIGDRVTAYACAKNLKLEYDPQDLISPDQLVTQAVSILELQDDPHRESMVTGRLELLASGIKLRDNQEAMLAVRLDNLNGVIKERLATTAACLDHQSQSPASVCAVNSELALA